MRFIILVTVAEIFKWLGLAIGLQVVAGAFAAISFAGYFAIHELKEKDVKEIEKKKLKTVREHLSKLAKECSESKKVTSDLENKFETLFDSEYTEAHEPIRILRMVDLSLLFSGILFLVTLLLDWLDSNAVSFGLPDLGLGVVEMELFAFGIFLLFAGLFNLERLRRMTSEEDIDPAPFHVWLLIGGLLAVDVALLYMLGNAYDRLNAFGKSLFFSTFLPFIGAPIVIFTWDREDWKRVLGMVLLFSPYIVILGWFILAILGVF